MFGSGDIFGFESPMTDVFDDGSIGSAFTNLLTEIASHGYIAIANDTPFIAPKPRADGSWDFASISSELGSLGKMKINSNKQTTDAIDWATKGQC